MVESYSEPRTSWQTCAAIRGHEVRSPTEWVARISGVGHTRCVRRYDSAPRRPTEHRCAARPVTPLRGTRGEIERRAPL